MSDEIVVHQVLRQFSVGAIADPCGCQRSEEKRANVLSHDIGVKAMKQVDSVL